MWRFEHEVEVRFNDCDPMGHVNNAVYLTYLEAAVFRAWCQYCVASAIIITLIFFTTLPEIGRLRGVETPAA